MNKPLIVIDMQPAFEASGQVLRPVLEIITKAQKRESDIIVVEYDLTDRDRYSETEKVTHKAITKQLKKYRKKHLVIKERNDGSSEVFNYMQKNEIPHQIVQVCGVNTSACVKETVWGLYQYDAIKKIQLLIKGCADNYLSNAQALRNFFPKEARKPKIKVVY